MLCLVWLVVFGVVVSVVCELAVEDRVSMGFEMILLVLASEEEGGGVWSSLSLLVLVVWWHGVLS